MFNFVVTTFDDRRDLYKKFLTFSTNVQTRHRSDNCEPTLVPDTQECLVLFKNPSLIRPLLKEPMQNLLIKVLPVELWNFFLAKLKCLKNFNWQFNP